MNECMNETIQIEHCRNIIILFCCFTYTIFKLVKIIVHPDTFLSLRIGNVTHALPSRNFSNEFPQSTKILLFE